MLKIKLSAIILLTATIPLSSCLEDTKDFLGGGDWGFDAIQKDELSNLKDYWDQNVQHDATSQHSFSLVTQGLRVILRNYYQKKSINIHFLITNAEAETEKHLVKDKHHKLKEKLNASNATTYMLTGMAKHLDNSSWYMTKDEYTSYLKYTKFTNVLGVGITLAPTLTGYGISEIWSQSPAYDHKKQLSNFIISSINGRDIKNLRLVQTLQMLQNGQHGEYVILKNSHKHKITLKKEMMKRDAVVFSHSENGNTLNIHVQRIISGVSRQISQYISKYIDKKLWYKKNKLKIFLDFKGATDNNWQESNKIISLFADKPIRILYDGIGASNDVNIDILKGHKVYPSTTIITADIDPYSSDSARAIFTTLVRKTQVLPLNPNTLRTLPDPRINSDIHIYSGGGTMHLTTHYYTILNN